MSETGVYEVCRVDLYDAGRTVVEDERAADGVGEELDGDENRGYRKNDGDVGAFGALPQTLHAV